MSDKSPTGSSDESFSAFNNSENGNMRNDRDEPAALTPNGSSRIEELNNRLFFRLHRLVNTSHTKGTKALQSKRVTTQQWSVLGALSRTMAKDGMSVGELSEYLAVTRQNLTGILDRLEADSIIIRVQTKDDRRVKSVKLTAKGSRLWKAIGPLIHSFYEPALKGLSLEDRQRLIDYINLIQRNMKPL